MTERDAFDERRRGLEESYFRKKEQELIEKMRHRAADEAVRRRMAEQVGIADEEILRDLHDLGYTGDTVKLLHLVPLIHLAWADGAMSPSERDLVFEAAKLRGVEPGTPAHSRLGEWLSARPSDTFFGATLRVIGAILHVIPAPEQDALRRDLLAYSTAIAGASGGILGFGAVSADERAVLARITTELERLHGPIRDEILPPPK